MQELSRPAGGRPFKRPLAQFLLAASPWFLLATSALPFTGLGSQEEAAASSDGRATVATSIASMLEERYVSPEIAARCAQHLRTLAKSGELGGADGDAEFAARLTEALRTIAKDQHLLVRVKAPRKAPEAAGDPLKVATAPHPLRARAERFERDRLKKFGFEKLQRFEGNVGYLDLRSFAHPGGGFETAVASMAFLASSDAIIFDLRENEGGSPGMVAFLCSHLFDEPTHLNTLYFREGDVTQEFWTHGVPGKAMPDVPVFVLTSSKTFSAAEEFSYNLRTQRRATLVGETTRGGANPGGLFSIDDTFEMVIPTGRAINPITGTNWEGVGVKPHIEVNADVALTIGLELATSAAEQHRDKVQAQWDAFGAAHQEALRLDDAKQHDEAAAVLVSSISLALKERIVTTDDLQAIAEALNAENRSHLSETVLTLQRDGDESD